MKPGWQTTEFWITVLSQIMAFLSVFGLFPGTDISDLQSVTTKIVAGITAVVTGALYIWGRFKLKKPDPVPIIPIPVPIPTPIVPVPTPVVPPIPVPTPIVPINPNV